MEETSGAPSHDVCLGSTHRHRSGLALLSHFETLHRAVPLQQNNKIPNQTRGMAIRPHKLAMPMLQIVLPEVT